MSQASFDARDYGGTGPQNYQKYFVPAIGAPLADELIRTASLRPQDRVLDVACGTGVVTRLAAKCVQGGGRADGLDVNPGMLAVARTISADSAIDWYETSAEAMPLPDGSYDVALCQMGLQFMPGKVQALREIRRILAPGGRALFNLSGPKPAVFAIMADALSRHIDPRCADFVEVVFSLHDAGELGGLMADAGFENVEIQTETQTLKLPAPRDFLWQYVHSTPLAGLVNEASPQSRDALTADVVERWQQFAVGDGLRLAVDMTTVQGNRADAG
jgi:ubiquinone/menaquinone biosynthesis C-methylase UbiE